VRRWMAAAIAVAALIVPVTAAAAVETFHRLEVLATANYTVSQPCPDGSTRPLLVSVIGGHEEEQESGESTLDSDFLTVRLRGFDCGGNLINDLALGTGEFSWSPSLQTASVTGTVTSRDGREIAVAVSWEGTGPLEVTQNTTTFPGFTGHFTGRERDAVATGTVVVDGVTVVNGSTTNASIESLEDNNISTGAGG
jgi:hypothetical protein